MNREPDAATRILTAHHRKQVTAELIRNVITLVLYGVSRTEIMKAMREGINEARKALEEMDVDDDEE